VQGDLHERFHRRAKVWGEKEARKQYIWEVLGYLLPHRRMAFTSTHNAYQPNDTDMFRNYFKIAWRNLQRNKGYAAINVLGLALSITCAILIFTLVRYHLSFNTFHSHADRIYRFVTEQHRDAISYRPNVPNPFGKVFREDYTFAEKVARIATFEEQLVTVRTEKEVRKFKEEEVAFAEIEFFDIFHYPLLQGDKTTALSQPHTAIITESVARKYFGNANPINQVFRLDNRVDFSITGILQDLPPNSDRQTEIYLSYPTLKTFHEWMGSDDSWGGLSSNMQCFALLKPGINPAEVEKVLPTYVKKYRPDNKNVHHYKLQPLADMHFDARYSGTMEKRNLWAFSLIGLFLLITACVNFINLATAQALSRSKEVGVRKVLGSLPRQLFGQFIAETALITFFALFVGVYLSLLALPQVNDLFKSRMTIDLLADRHLLVFIPLLALVVIFLSGSYPGLVLSRFQPVLALKGKLSQHHVGGFSLRRALIVTQFAISQMLIIGMIVIASQMRYSQQSDLGFDKESVVMIPVASAAKPGTVNTVKDRFLNVPGVEKVSLCFSAPSSSSNNKTAIRYDTRTEEEVFPINIRAADDQYLDMFDLQLVAGRNIFPADTAREYVVNESVAKKLGLQSPEELIGKNITVNGEDMTGPIVGVVKDFHDQSFHENINAVFITSRPDWYEYFAVKVNLTQAKTTLPALEKIWSTTYPDQLYEYEFLDESIAHFYETEELMLKLVQAFAGIAIFIGCLGLYGLVSFMAVQKTKEIGIRKVLGASITNLLWLFGKEFSRLIAIAFLVATPIAWYVMHIWLQDFQYQINIGAEVFVLAIGFTSLIAVLTVSWQSIKAARANPVKSLKTE
jgi:putative ABC transport system permease protein